MIENQIWVVCDITGLGEWQNTNQPTEGRDMIENLDNQIWVVCDITGLGEWQNTNQPTKGRD